MPDGDVFRRKEVKENTRANLTQRKCACPLPFLFVPAPRARIVSRSLLPNSVMQRARVLGLCAAAGMPVRLLRAGSTCSGRRARASRSSSPRCTPSAPRPQPKATPRAWCACCMASGHLRRLCCVRPSARQFAATMNALPGWNRFALSRHPAARHSCNAKGDVLLEAGRLLIPQAFSTVKVNLPGKRCVGRMALRAAL